MALPNPLYIACFPLQEYFVNKDTGFPLANGYVEFFSDPAFTVPKDVYQQSYIAAPTETYTYTSLGSVLQLSGVGTFQDNNSNDIIPFLFPYTGTPQSPGTVQLYWIRVWSGVPNTQGSVLQFTRAAWPPNLTQSSSPADVFESSQNLFTNPEFSIVDFVPDSGQTFFTINVSTTSSMQIAPGWSLSWAGTGTIKLTQDLIVNAALVQTNPSYALKIDVSAGVSNVKLTQRLLQSPRIFDARYLSIAAFVKSDSGTADTIIMNYVASNGATYQVLNGVTLTNNAYELLAGVGGAPVFITQTNNTDSPLTGYVDFTLEVPLARITTFTSFFGVTVQNASSLVTNVQQTNAQQTNATFWYYKDQLAYKPIPSYTLGWDFAMNPFQAQGIAGFLYNPSSPGKSVYVADQTLLFQSTVNTTTVSQLTNRALNLAVATNPSSLALIQYLGPNEAQELLNNPVCSQIRAKVSTGALRGQIHLYYTVDATLPVMAANPATGGYTLVSAVDNTTGAPTVGGGGNFGTWVEVTRDTLGAANFTLSTTMSNNSFAGWNESAVAGISSAKFFAIVVSFAQVPVSTNIEIEHISLQKGYIPTAPAAMSFGETLTGLQQYYEKSYELGTSLGTITLIGSTQFGGTSGGANAEGATSFYKTSKRVAPTWNSGTGVYNLAPYSTQGTINNVYNSTTGDKAITGVTSGISGFSFVYTGTGGGVAVGQGMSLQWVADARYGIQN
jgi:hypothetical protein